MSSLLEGSFRASEGEPFRNRRFDVTPKSKPQGEQSTYKSVDYSLYLVTDSTPEILGDGDLAGIVDNAIRGGVTVVQYRDKKSDTVELIRVATKLHNVTQQRGVPLIINDRVDVALAVGAEGVHLGQDDMDIETAGKLLGSGAIVGATVCSLKEAEVAYEKGATYLGVGTVFSTATKTDSKSVIGISGLRRILSSLSDRFEIPTVAIGGINTSTAPRMLYQSRAATHHGIFRELSGIAVVSAIIASSAPHDTASKLRHIVDHPGSYAAATSPTEQSNDEAIVKALLDGVHPLLRTLANTKPLSHNMTNTVVQNMAANIALALGASPIMAGNCAEAPELASIPGSALVINMGTVSPDGLEHYTAALRAYNSVGRPVLFDPVGAGATSLRRKAVYTLLQAGYFTVIKGNEAEIRTVWKQGSGQEVAGPETSGAESEVAQRGVDSGDSTTSEEAAGQLVRDLAEREHNVVLMTGAVDYLSDGYRTLAIKNGHPLLGEITGSGCSLGTVISACLAVDGIDGAKKDTLRAVLAGVLIYEIAAEKAAKSSHVDGSGTFTPAFIDSIASLRKSTTSAWLDSAKVEEVKVTQTRQQALSGTASIPGLMGSL